MPYAWHDFNDQWDYSDPAATVAKFRSRLPEAEKTCDQDYVLQLKTQIARALGLQGKFSEAHALLDHVQAAMEPGSLVEVRYLLERGRAFNSDKQAERALFLFSEASALAQRLGADFFTVDALHMLAIATLPQTRLDWNLKAIEFARNSADPRARGWLATLHNNAGWALFDEGRFTEALEQFESALPLREQKGEAEPLRVAKWCVARALRALDRIEEALAIQRSIEPETEDGFVYEEIAECLLAQDRPAEAKPYFAKAFALLQKLDWIAGDTARIERLKVHSV